MVRSKAAMCRAATWVFFGLFIGAQCLDSYLQQPPLLVVVLRVAPLLLFVPGMAAGRARSYLLLCVVCLLYFMTLVLRLFAAPTDPLLITAMIALVGLFTAAALYARWQHSPHWRDHRE